MKFKESTNLELKESLQLKDEIGKAVSAFANSGKGKIIVGISDKGKVIGLQIGKKTLHDLVHYIKSNTDPQIYPNISIKKINLKEVIEIKVKESHDKPVLFKGRAYKRVGNTSQKVSASEIKSLVKESQQIFWDKQVCKEATLKDIDSSFIKKSFIPRYEDVTSKRLSGKITEVLTSLGCIKNGKITNAGILLFGKEPRKFFINSYIALARYKGIEIGTERLDFKEFEGNIFEQIDECETYIKQHIAMMSRQSPYKVQRDDIPEYGLFSIREIVTNAVCHRDYENQHAKVIIRMFDDRIEVDNPGGLPNHITPQNILSKQFSRNPTISKCLSKVGYIEDLGEGWNKIIKEHKKHLLKPQLPLIEADDSSTVITLFSAKEKFTTEKKLGEKVGSKLGEKVGRKLGKNQARIIDLITKDKFVTIGKLSKELGISTTAVENNIKKLKEKKLLKRIGGDKGGLWEILG